MYRLINTLSTCVQEAKCLDNLNVCAMDENVSLNWQTKRWSGLNPQSCLGPGSDVNIGEPIENSDYKAIRIITCHQVESWPESPALAYLISNQETYLKWNNCLFLKRKLRKKAKRVKPYSEVWMLFKSTIKEVQLDCSEENKDHQEDAPNLRELYKGIMEVVPKWEQKRRQNVTPQMYSDGKASNNNKKNLKGFLAEMSRQRKLI